MMKIFILCFMLIFCSFSGAEYVLVKTIPFSNAWLTTDKMGNAYVIDINQLFKFDPNGKPLDNFTNYNNGVLRSADCSDPMKPVLFFPDFSRIVSLNNKLAVQAVIELRSLGFVLPTLICPSQNLGYWIFDLATFQLKKIDPSLNVIYESGNLQQLTGLDLKPTIMLEAENYVYLSDPQNGILVFDVYGVYYKTIPLKEVKSLQRAGDRLFYVRNNSFYSYDLKKIEESEIPLPPHDQLLCARIEQNRLYLLTTSVLSIYSF